MTAAAPTRKQAQVLGHLKRGKTPAQIAKQMGISKNGVYGHIRKLKAAGLLDTNGGEEAAEASSNGHQPVGYDTVAAIEKARAVGIERIQALEKTIEQAEVEKHAILDALAAKVS